MCSPLRFLTVVQKAVLMELFFKMQFVENILVYAIGVFTTSFFCYCFYEAVVPKIFLMSVFLLFIFISYPLKIFRFDNGIPCYLGVVPLLKTLSRLPLEWSNFMPDLISHVCLQYSSSRAVLIMIYTGCQLKCC